MSRDLKYIGMDVHKEAVVIAVLNSSGKLVMESIRRVRSDPNSNLLTTPRTLAMTMKLAYQPLAGIAREQLLAEDLEFEDSIVYEKPSASPGMQRFRLYGERGHSN